MKFSKYQQDILSATVATNNNIAVESTAGSGKTTTIIEAAKMIPYGKTALFVAFAKSIVEELKARLPQGVECMTMHSIGYRAIANYYPGKTSFKEDKMLQFITPFYDLANKKNWIEIYAIERLLSLARARMATVNKEGLERVALDYLLDVTDQQISKGVEALANFYKANDNLDRFNVIVDFQDMIEMCVRNQKIRMPQYDFVMIDEVQDMSELDHLFLKRLRKQIGGRMIGVGDPHQCQPSGTRITLSNGFTRLIEEIRVGDKLLQHSYSTQKKAQFTEVEVLEVNRRKFLGKLIRVKLKNGERSTYTPNHKCIVINKKKQIHTSLTINLLDSISLGFDRMIEIWNEGNKKGIGWKEQIREIEEIEIIDNYQGCVHSLSVSGNKTYIADNIVTHNSIYGFRGSSPDSFDKFSQQPNTVILPLSISYRCSKKIVEEARRVYPDIEPYVENQEGEVIRNGSIDMIEEGDMVLCRNTRPLIDTFFQLLDRNKKAYIVGSEMEKGLKQVLNCCESTDSSGVALDKLKGTKERLESELKARGVSNPKNHARYIAHDEKVDILKVLLIKYPTVYDVEKFIESVFDDKEREGVKLMTVHKSKGLESNTVFFIERFDGKKLIPSPYAITKDALRQEKNLLFVAITRAKKKLVYLNL